MSKLPRHKVFISYHHEDQDYRDWLVHMIVGDVVDISVRYGDIDNSNIGTAAIRQRIRDEFIADATVTIVLIGPNTHTRKHVDWEIASSLRVTRKNSRCGLLGILLPNHPDYDQKQFDLKKIPSRLADNLKGNDPYALLYHWPRRDQITDVLTWIHEAFLRKDTISPNNTRRALHQNRSRRNRGRIRDRYRLESISLDGFKTIKELADFRPNPLTVLIGPNGAGKSNFISFFSMMRQMMADRDNLPTYVGQQGGASKLLHDGPATTEEIGAILTVTTPKGENHYCFRLAYAAGDTLIFNDEHHQHFAPDNDEPVHWHTHKPGPPTPRLLFNGDPDTQDHERIFGIAIDTPRLLIHADHDSNARATRDFLREIRAYQFHNTAATARIRTKWNIYDSHFLKEDAANIAPYLLHLRDRESWHYRRIVDSIRLILPFFSDFELESDYGHVLLAWRERGSDQVFDASQASDGMLRVIALVTLLLQPQESLPDVLILDEPELGLHPYAINVIGGLIGAVSKKIQVIVATQSAALVDCFEPEDIVVVEREGRRSVFRHLDTEALGEWLKDYSLSELWQKNVLGGRP